MGMSDNVANYILSLLREENGCAQIRRNELADVLGCVPSQINYVITSRFTPEQGYLVESRRGGSGYIRITRVSMGAKTLLMHVVNAVGGDLDAATAHAMLSDLFERDILSAKEANLIASAVSVSSLSSAGQEERDAIRAAIFKNMLLTAAQNS